MNQPISQSGSPSRVFGDRFPYPLNGKMLMRAFAEQFAAEFNQQAKLYLIEQYGHDRVKSFPELVVTGAYPTSRQQCPRIAVMQQSTNPRQLGIGGEVEVTPDGAGGFRHFRGEQCRDLIAVHLCTLNPEMRDDLSVWFQQYMIDAMEWALPQLGNVFDCQCENIQDDAAEYQGTQGQPGFQFYVSRMSFRIGYDLLVVRNVDELRSLINWQAIADNWWVTHEQTLQPVISGGEPTES